MPAKTVVFTNVRKFDGDKFRWITSGEYIQMSGRAGRRGLDAFGICILMLDEKLEPAVAKGMIKGSPDPLNSAFHLSYNMLLNQMRCEEGNPEVILRQSFHQFQMDRALPQIQKRVEMLEEERDAIVIEEEEKVREYSSLMEQLQKVRSDIRDVVFAPQYCLPFLQPGRLVRILELSSNGSDIGEPAPTRDVNPVWGVIINFEKAQAHARSNEDFEVEEQSSESKFVVDVLVNCIAKAPGRRNKVAQPISLNEPGEPVVTAIPLSHVESLSAIRIRIPKDLRPIEAREHTINILKEVFRRFPDGVQLLDPEDDLQVKSGDYRKAVRRVEALESLLANHPLSNSPTLVERLKVLQEKEKITAAIRIAKKEVRSTSNLVFRDELKARRRVLRRLGYATADDLVELKGRVACEISSADELILTELIFSGVLKEASVEQIVALLSCLVWQEKTKNLKKLREDLAGPYAQLQDTARRVGKVQVECKMPVDVEDYVALFRPDIMEVVYAWCKGATFSEIMKLAEVFEGSLIRAMKRLEEVLQQLVVASQSIGDEEMEAQFQSAITMIKRDIVFAASLYL